MSFVKLLLSIITLHAIVTAQTTFTPHRDSQRKPLTFIARDIPADSIVRLIVEFQEAPLFVAQNNAFAAVSPASYQNRFSEFVSDLQSASLQSNGTPSAASISLRREYFRSFFGTSVDVPYSMVAMIERLPYVKKVHSNKQMKAFLHKSVPQIRANEVRAGTGKSGEGVVVGIIDTGIDYLHPALGGGIGSTFKVIGGYDFVNNDSDPMDDNGHGTHVAGIVSADAVTVKGVAPKSKLYGFKVLNEQGGGSEDDIIAAIERTVDPNDDGNMSDKLDVVNMSLGSESGNADDAASVAVDYAVRLGVTFAIAAGNDGRVELVEGKENNYYYTGMETIGSPGTSRLAITVGAVDSTDKLAYFSSKGPLPVSFGIKPDVVAPGVNILSLFPGNEYLIESGTSMASPMIAGVAALLKSNDPSLTPAQIKSRIVNSAVPLGMNPMLQGTGRVDAMRAVALSSFVVPTNLSFGLDDPSKTTWTRPETLYVTNTKNISQQYALSFTGGGAGITVSAVPSNFAIASGGTQMVIVTISVNNAVIPIVDEDIKLYDGFVHVKSAADTLHLPWSFARTTKMTLTFSDADPQFVGTGNTSYITSQYNKMYSRIHWIDTKTAEITGPTMETYNFGVYFPVAGKLLLKEGFQFTGANTFAFNSADAVHTLHFDGNDNNGVPFGTSANVRRTVRVNLPAGFLFAPLSPGSKTLMISPAGMEYEFQPIEALIDLKGEKRFVLPQYPTFKGISSDVHASNPSAKYFHQQLRFTVPEGVTKTRFFSDVISTEILAGENYYNTVLVGTDTLDAPNGTAAFDLYMMMPMDPSFSSAVAFHTNSTYQSNYYLDMSTRYLSVVNDSILMGLPSQELPTSVKSPDGATLNFGESPVYIFNLSYNNSFGPSIHFNPFFFGSLFETRYSDVNSGSYAIYNSAGTKLAEDALNVFPRFPFMTDPGKYSLVLSAQGYTLRNAKGTVTLRNDVDLSKEVPDAPVITSFQVKNAAKRNTNALQQNEQGTLRFSSKVFAFPFQLPVFDSTKAYYRKYKTTQWLPLTVVNAGSDAEIEGAIYSVALAPATAEDSVGIDLKIRLADSYGNAAEQVISPAFAVGNWLDDGTTPVEEDPKNIPQHFALEQNFPNPFNPVTTIRYDVPQSGPVLLTVYDMLGRDVATIVQEYKRAGRYSADFRGANLASGVYFYRLTAGGRNAVRKMMLVK